MKNKKKNTVGRRAGSIIAIIAILISVGLMIYPFVSNYIFEHRKDSIITTYEKQCEDISDESMKEEVERAERYNRIICAEHIQLQDPFKSKNNEINEETYNAVMNLNGDGIMGYVSVPKINVKLPIYHSTSASVLSKGVGHLEGTSLPLEGESVHSVLTGHTGLSNAKLFTDLTQLEIKDNFYVYVLDQKLAYEIDQIKVVLPEEIQDLSIENGKEYCTLVTCTPYGINSHRLLVRGHRIPYVEKKVQEEESTVSVVKSQWMSQYVKSLIIAFVVIVLIFIIAWLIDRIKKKKRGKNEK